MRDTVYLKLRLARDEGAWRLSYIDGDKALLAPLWHDDNYFDLPADEQRFAAEDALEVVLARVRQVAKESTVVVRIYGRQADERTLRITPRAQRPKPPPKPRRGWVNNVADLAEILGESTTDDQGRQISGKQMERWLSRRVYKSTDCGAWLALKIDEATAYGPVTIGTVQLGSIVEGIDPTVDADPIAFPFTKRRFWKAMDWVEGEARALWNDTHGCPDCWPGPKNGEGWPMTLSGEEVEDYWPVDPDCKTCGGSGRII